MLCTLKGVDLALYKVLKGTGNQHELTSGKRNIQLREHDPNQTVNIMPDDMYIEHTDGLIKQNYRISIDES